jgi:hypothetical protein
VSQGFCDVEIEGDCDEPADVWFERPRYAAKPHQCCECRAVIAKGERHINITMKSGGRWDSFRVCLACDEIAREFMSPRIVGGWLWESFDSAWQEGANVQGCMNRVSTATAKQKLLDKWKAWKGLAA